MIDGASAALCLVLGGAMIIAPALFQSQIERRRLAVRVAALQAENRYAPITTAPGREILFADLLRRALTLGLEQTWGIKSSNLKLLVVAACASAAATLVSGGLLHAPGWIVFGIALITGYGAPRLLMSLEQRRAETAFLEHFPNVVDMIIRMLRAGLPVTAAIRAVAEEAPEAVRQVFANLGDQIEIGRGVGEAFTLAAERVRLPDFRFFAASVALQSSTGGNLAATLETLSEIIRRRRAMRLKAKALTSEVRMSSYVLTALPVLAIGSLLVMNPHYLSPLLSDPRGRLILLAAVSSLSLGLIAMRQLMRRAGSGV